MTIQNIKFYDDFSEFYDLINVGREMEMEYYTENTNQGDTVLEVACGTGTLTKVLVKAGAIVTGLDASDSMLRIARRRMPQVQFHHGDMRNFCIGSKFDNVICPFNSLMHLHDDEEVICALRCLAEHCNEAGKVIVDVYGGDSQYIPRQMAETEILDLPDHLSGRHLKGYESSTFDPEKQRLNINLRIADVDLLQTISESSYSMRFFEIQELNYLFASAGLAIQHRRDAYKISAKTQQPRHLIIARPANGLAR